jgi:chaperonin GroEL (HSP60 family)
MHISHSRIRLINSSNLQIQTAKGEVIITNDGATILKSIQALHPAAKMASLSVLSAISGE